MKFLTDEDAANYWFAAQPSASYLHGLKKLEQWSKMCTELRKAYCK